MLVKQEIDYLLPCHLELLSWVFGDNIESSNFLLYTKSEQDEDFLVHLNIFKLLKKNLEVKLMHCFLLEKPNLENLPLIFDHIHTTYPLPL